MLEDNVEDFEDNRSSSITFLYGEKCYGPEETIKGYSDEPEKSIEGYSRIVIRQTQDPSDRDLLVFEVSNCEFKIGNECYLRGSEGIIKDCCYPYAISFSDGEGSEIDC